MARAKKPAKKAATKKPAAKKTAAKKKEVVVYTASDVKLNTVQTNSIKKIHENEDRIHAKAQDMLKIAFDSGQRLLKLKEAMQKQYGRVWKAWCQENVDSLGVGYEQLTRYMKLAANPDQYALLDESVTSIEGAVKQIEHIKNPEKAAQRAEARAARQAKKSEVPAATAGIISNATIEEIQKCTDIGELRDLLKLIHARIDELEGVDDEPGDEAESSEAEDQEDIADALS